MKYCLGLDNLQSLAGSESKGVDVLLGHRYLSRLGNLDTESLMKRAREVRQAGARPVLEWDVLMTQDRFNFCCGVMQKLELDQFDAIRVQDPGALHWVKQFGKPIQLVLENGNHNLTGIKKWIELAGKHLERIILSLELPSGVLSTYCRELEIPVEFQMHGPLLLFYTPRSLLSPLAGERGRQSMTSLGFLKAMGKSEETPHNGFKVIENFHGTFMFHPKDHSLVKQVDEIEKTGVGWVRLEQRHLENAPSLLPLIGGDSQENGRWLENWPSQTIRGFWGANRTSALFKKLTNQNNKRKDENYLGEVLDVKKGSYLALQIRTGTRTLKKGDPVVIKTPEGKTKTTRITMLKSPSGKQVEEACNEEIVLIPHHGGVSVRSSVFLDNTI